MTDAAFLFIVFMLVFCDILCFVKCFDNNLIRKIFEFSEKNLTRAQNFNTLEWLELSVNCKTKSISNLTFSHLTERVAFWIFFVTNISIEQKGREDHSHVKKMFKLIQIKFADFHFSNKKLRRFFWAFTNYQLNTC